MTWKMIAQSVTGTSHYGAGKGCEDAMQHSIVIDNEGNEVLICFVSDGAGSAEHASFASALTVAMSTAYVERLIANGNDITEANLYAMAEEIFDTLAMHAAKKNTPLIEYSCTLSGCIATKDKTAYIQVGDGAIVRYDESDYYNTIWWPQSGEYHNTTCFITDSNNFANLMIKITETTTHEIAILTDGLQLLSLNMDDQTVFQPFFANLFTHLRSASTEDAVSVLNSKLRAYLGSAKINERTDDDKTLFLATRL